MLSKVRYKRDFQHTLSQARLAPYTPHHTYRAPAGGAHAIPRRRTSVAAIAKTFTKDVILLTRADGDSIPRGSRRSVLYDDSGRIANIHGGVSVIME